MEDLDLEPKSKACADRYLVLGRYVVTRLVLNGTRNSQGYPQDSILAHIVREDCPSLFNFDVSYKGNELER